MRAKFLFLFLIAGFSIARAQAPTPIIVQAATAAPAAAAPPTSVSATPVVSSTTLEDALRTLEKIKASNDEVLAKQKAALERLEELEQAAEQLRIFGKRG